MNTGQESVSTGIEGVSTGLGSQVFGNRSDHDVVNLYLFFFFKLCVSRVWGWCVYVSVSDLPGAGGISSCDPCTCSELVSSSATDVAHL